MPVRRTVLTSSANDDKTSEIPLLSLSGDDDYENHSDDSHDDDDNHSPGDQSRVNLKRTLGIRSSVSCIVGIIIGSGIFLSPQGVILYCHSPGLSLIVWVLCGVYALLGAMCYAELGTTYAASGGAYTYLMAMFGEMPAFLLLWSYFIVRIPTGNCLSALIFAKYVLQDVFTCVSPPDSAVRIVAFLVIVIVVLLNCVSIKLTTRVIEVCTYSKVLALVIIIISGIVMLFKGNVDNFQEPFRNSATSPGQVALGFYAGIYSYAGWDSLNSITEELKDPHRTLPVSLGISMCLVTVIYVLTNLAYLTVLTPTEILLSSAVAVSYGGKILAAATWCIPVLVAVSVFGGVNAGFLMASRILFVGARSSHLPKVFSMVNMKYFTPIPALLIMGLFSSLMLVSSNVYELLNYLEFVDCVGIVVPVVGLLIYRWKEPDWERPIKVWLIVPVLFTLVSIYLIVLPVITRPFQTLIGMALILTTGVPIYLLMKKEKKWSKDGRIQNFLDKIVLLIQKSLLVVPEENESSS